MFPKQPNQKLISLIPKLISNFYFHIKYTPYKIQKYCPYSFKKQFIFKILIHWDKVIFKPKVHYNKFTK